MPGETIRTAWMRLEREHPLVHCITNQVSMDIMANTLLAIGASPAMVLAAEEVEEFSKFASALLVNVGTITAATFEAMLAATAAYRQAGKPWVLDPVAAGATKYRMEKVMQLLSQQPTLIRGNASEIMAIAGSAGAGGRGTDSTVGSEAALEAGKQLARKQKCIVAISGATDLVTDGRRVIRVTSGHPSMQQITATGCTVTAVIAAFLATKPADPLLAAAHALCIYGLSAEAYYVHHHMGDATAAGASAPGSLRTHMIDTLASGPEEANGGWAMDAEARIEEDVAWDL